VIAIDTNVLVRFLTRDDPEQAARVRALFATLSAENPALVCREVVLELVWVLGYSYNFSRTEIGGALEGLLAAVELEVEDADVVSSALRDYVSEAADFADLMILGATRKRGAAPLVTFDTRAARMSGVKLVDE
jgi:predicted nucleic-acid-binding protein